MAWIDRYTKQQRTLVSKDTIGQISKRQYWNDSAKFFARWTMPILQKLARIYITTAARFTPPGNHGKKIGTTTIAPHYYHCLIQDLDWTAHYEPYKLFYDDWEAIRHHYHFKVMRNKYGEPLKLIAYTQTKDEAVQLARIKNRGLAKYSWGSILNSTDAYTISHRNDQTIYTEEGTMGMYEQDMPAMFRKLGAKSPNIEKYKWGRVVIKPTNMQNGQFEIKIDNRHMTGNQGFMQVIIKNAGNNVKKAWNKVIYDVNNVNYRQLMYFLDYQLKRIDLKYKKEEKQ